MWIYVRLYRQQGHEAWIMLAPFVRVAGYARQKAVDIDNCAYRRRPGIKDETSHWLRALAKHTPALTGGTVRCEQRYDIV